MAQPYLGSGLKIDVPKSNPVSSITSAFPSIQQNAQQPKPVVSPTLPPSPVPQNVPQQLQTPVDPSHDPNVIALRDAIKQRESKGNYRALGQSGEAGAYQFTQSTWNNLAQKYLGDPKAKLTPENQDHVVYSYISDLKKQGLRPDQIAGQWNHGNVNYGSAKGVNKYGVRYDTPGYVRDVMAYYKKNVDEAKQSSSQTNATNNQQPKKEGFLIGLGKAIAKPFVTAGVTGMAALEGAANLGAAGLNALTGNKKAEQYNLDQANKVTQQGYNVPGFGQTAPIGASIGEPGGFKKETERMIGTGAGIASTLMPVGSEVEGGLLAGRPIISGALQGAVQGATSGAGDSLSSGNAKPLDVAGSALGGGIFGGVLGAAVPTVKAVQEFYQRPAEKLLASTIKAPVSAKGFDKSLSTVMEDLKGQAGDIKNLDTFNQALKDGKQQIWNEVKSRVRGATDKTMVDGTKIAERIKKLQPSSYQLRVDPEGAKAYGTFLESLASKFDGQIPADEAEQMLEELNAQHSAYYAKNNISQSLAQKSDPKLAAELELADGLRNGLDQVLEGFGDLKKKYGAYKQVQQYVDKVVAREAKKELTDLPTRISAGEAVSGVAKGLLKGNPLEAGASLLSPLTTKAMQGSESADAKVAEAFGKIAKQSTKKAPLLSSAQKGFLNRGIQTGLVRGTTGYLTRNTQ